MNLFFVLSIFAIAYAGKWEYTMEVYAATDCSGNSFQTESVSSEDEGFKGTGKCSLGVKYSCKGAKTIRRRIWDGETCKGSPGSDETFEEGECQTVDEFGVK